MLALAVGISLVLLAINLRADSVTYTVLGGIVSLLALARLIADDALIIGHECCNAGADVTITLTQNDLNVVAGSLAVFVIFQFVLVIERQLR